MHIANYMLLRQIERLSSNIKPICYIIIIMPLKLMLFVCGPVECFFGNLWFLSILSSSYDEDSLWITQLFGKLADFSIRSSSHPQGKVKQVLCHMQKMTCGH